MYMLLEFVWDLDSRRVRWKFCLIGVITFERELISLVFILCVTKEDWRCLFCANNLFVSFGFVEYNVFCKHLFVLGRVLLFNLCVQY